MDDQWERVEIEVTKRRMEQVWFCRMDKDDIDNHSINITSLSSENLRTFQLPLDFDLIHEMGVVDHVWLLPAV